MWTISSAADAVSYGGQLELKGVLPEPIERPSAP